MQQWVTSFKVSYTLNGKYWLNVENGRVFDGNHDQNQKIRVTFEDPVYARVIRIHPITWKNGIGLRFDAIYIDMETPL